MSFFSLVPFEDSIYLVRSTESQPLDEEQLAVVNKHLEQGKTVAEIQDVLKDVWNQ
tara:strand:+ start:262 stop:429 length:168 start_codon:yes stop_codon:yes gene_type:complete